MELIISPIMIGVGATVRAAQVEVKVNIENQCSDIKLVSPVYFSDGATRMTCPDQKAEQGGSMETSFVIDTHRKTFEGAFMCQIKRKDINADSQPSTHTNQTPENEPKSTQLLVAWKISRFGELFAYALLINHDADVVWNMGKLKGLYHDHRCRLNASKSCSNTWRMDENTLLVVELDLMGQGQFVIHAKVTGGEENDTTQLPIDIGSRE
jgi:hypothetical protein